MSDRGVPEVLVVAGIGEAGGAGALAAALAVGVARACGQSRPVLLCDLHAAARGPRPTVLSSPLAARLEQSLREDEEEWSVAARGHVCCLALPGEETLERVSPLIATLPAQSVAVVHLPARLLAQEIEAPWLGAGGALLRAELPRDRSLAALAVRELHAAGMRVKVAGRALGRVAARRAGAGIDPGGGASRRTARWSHSLLDESGQAMPAMLGAVAILMLATLALAAIGGAVTGKGRAQRAADLAAISAARSMRDDFPRLFTPARLPGGLANPLHLSKRAYLGRARAAAIDGGRHNGVAPRRLRVDFPDAVSFAPVRARVSVRAAVEGTAIAVTAVAEAAQATGWSGVEAVASGGGYSGSLAYRQGKPMRPDVARAFDAMAAAARQAGLGLVVSSAFRSDVEQARLFAAHPDPRWVAPPGRSLHRCGTELDLGPAGAYGWLASNAPRFGFLRRYSWEPWHFGFTRGPAPCSAAGSLSVKGLAGGGGEGVAPGGLPAFVPARFRAPILRAAALRNVSAGLLAAQILAESNFNPFAVSPAGAQGIAQFMPGTARAYGLRNPFDAAAAIDAQARLMADLLRQFHSIPLALAAYNAGPGAVAGCHCVPSYPETRAYVARILGLLGGAGELAAPPLDVHLVS